MTFTKESVKTRTNADLESWKKYFYDRVKITIQEFSARKDTIIKRFVEIEAEKDIKSDILGNASAPSVDKAESDEMHKRISEIEDELNLIRDTQKSDEVKTNARLDFVRQQIVLIEDELELRKPKEEVEVVEEPEKESNKSIAAKKSAKKPTKKKSK